MLRLPFGDHKNQYTVQRTYEYSERLARLWSFFGWVLIVASVAVIVLSSFLWRYQGTRVVNGENFQKVFSTSPANAAANLGILVTVSVLICFLLSYTMRLSIESRWSLPGAILGMLSSATGAIGIQIFGHLFYRAYVLRNEVDTVASLQGKFKFNVEPRTLVQMQEIFTYSSIIILIFLAVVSLTFFTASLLGVLTIVETFKRTPLPAKTLGRLKLRYHDGMSSTKIALSNMVLEQLKAMRLTEELTVLEHEKALALIKDNATLVLYEDEIPVGFFVRSKKYDVLLGLWVDKKKQRHQFGKFMMNDFLEQAQKKGADLPLVASVPASYPAQAKLFLLDSGWIPENEALPTGEKIYSWMPAGILLEAEQENEGGTI